MNNMHNNTNIDIETHNEKEESIMKNTIFVDRAGTKQRMAFAMTAAVAWGLILSASPEATGAVVNDDFNENHTYWNGSSVDVSGTIWDNMQGTAGAALANANITNRGLLTIRSTGSLDGSIAPFNVPALYINVTGDFDARVQTLPADNPGGFPTHSLAAWTSDQAQGVHIDNILNIENDLRFRDLDAPDEFLSTAGGVDLWLRLVRSGNDFTGYYGTDGIGWTPIGTMTRAYGSTLRVGVAAWDVQGNTFNARFDNFQTDVIPEPSTLALLLIGAGLCHLRRRK